MSAADIATVSIEYPDGSVAVWNVIGSDATAALVDAFGAPDLTGDAS